MFELCAETLESCRAAAPGGADRIELCTELDVGGLTPPPEFVRAAVAQSGLPVHVLLRPTADHFRYTPKIFAAIAEALGAAKHAGAAGVVLGLLHADGTVDREHTRALVEQAAPLPVTFHRAFDETPDLAAALEAVIATGCARVLTSGGAPDVLSGASALAGLVEQAAGRIAVAAGGGLRLRNAASVAALSHCRHFHASLRDPEQQPGGPVLPLAGRIRDLTALLRNAATSTPAEA